MVRFRYLHTATAVGSVVVVVCCLVVVVGGYCLTEQLETRFGGHITWV